MRFPHHQSRRTSSLRVAVLLGLGFTLAACSSPEQAPAGDTGTAAISTTVAPAGATSLNVDADGVMLRGYDPVAYFTQAAATRGNASFTADHGGATYRFANAEHRDTFVANPEMYVPQYGGYCAMGVAIDKKLDGDPTHFTVHDGKLYLNVNGDAVGMWREKLSEHLAMGEQNWPAVKDRAGFDKM
jgi:YHS domain-containing protein